MGRALTMAKRSAKWRQAICERQVIRWQAFETLTGYTMVLTGQGDQEDSHANG